MACERVPTLAELSKVATPPPGKVQVYDAAQVSLTFHLTKQGKNKTLVKVDVRYTTLSHGFWSSGNTLDWKSNGLTEQAILGGIQRRLTGRMESQFEAAARRLGIKLPR